MAKVRARARFATGTSLVEILVAMLVTALSMLGILALMANSVAGQKDSSDRRTAAVLASGFAERVAANFAGMASYTDLSYDAGGALPVRPACGTGATDICTPAQLAAADWADLIRVVADRLPGGAARVAAGDDNRSVIVAIGWQDPKRERDLPTGAATVDTTCSTRGIATADLSYRCYEIRTFP